jgi:hypothetical protein
MNKIDGQYAWMMTSTPIPPEAIKQVIPLTTEMKQDFVKRQNESWGKSGARIPQEDVPHFLGTEDSTQPLPGEEFPDYITRQMENDKDYTRGVAVATKAGIPVVRSYVDLPPVAEGKVRIYHGTRPDALEGIAREGVKNFPGHGQAGVLATTYEQNEHKGYGRPNVIVADVDPSRFFDQGAHGGIVMLNRIMPEEIVGTYVPEVTPGETELGYNDFLRYQKRFNKNKN